MTQAEADQDLGKIVRDAAVKAVQSRGVVEKSIGIDLAGIGWVMVVVTVHQGAAA